MSDYTPPISLGSHEIDTTPDSDGDLEVYTPDGDHFSYIGTAAQIALRDLLNRLHPPVAGRVITTVEELDALPDDSLVLASGKYLTGQGDFTDCWIRPIPDHITGGTGARLWESLIYLDGGVHNMTRNDCITLPATVLHEPAEASL